MTAKKPITNPALASWDALNAFLMRTTDEKELSSLLKAELEGRKRAQFVTRIHSRINKVRADRERAELEAKIK